MNKKMNRAITCIFAVALLVCAANTMTFAQTGGYSGKVTKYKDFQSGVLIKSNKSDAGTNNATKKPSGSFSSWVEISSTGNNASYKTAYSKTGKYHMSYKQKLDAPETCADILYTDKYKLKLNISTALVNFESGSVMGNWSPDDL